MSDADSYRKEWAAKIGKSEREIYVPEGLREPCCKPIVFNVMRGREPVRKTFHRRDCTREQA